MSRARNLKKPVLDAAPVDFDLQSTLPARLAVSPGLRLARALGMTAALLLICQIAFVSFSPRILHARPGTDPEVVTPWARWAVAEHDGNETFVALAGMSVFLLTVASVTWLGERWRPDFLSLLVCVAGLAAAGIIVLRTRSSEFFLPIGWGARLIFILIGLPLVWLLLHGKLRLNGRWRIAATAASGMALVGAIVLSLPPASVIDYSYYVGPALKHVQGERFGTFYMQYTLLDTLLFEGMTRLGMRLHQMELMMALELAAWYVIYWLLVRRLFRQRSIGMLLLAALVAARFLDIRDHPAVMPQVLPDRLDMWVLLLLSAHRWGIRSLQTSCAFALAYVFDATFGFLSAVAYGLTLLASFACLPERQPLSKLAGRVALLLAPLALAAAFQKLTFGSFLSPAAQYYVGVQIGFLPISPRSLFWPIALLLGCATSIFVLYRQERSSRFGLFICLLALLHLTYFFGRSHDHNLLNISSMWLFAGFLALDQATHLGRLAAPVGGAILLALAFMGYQNSAQKMNLIGSRLRRGVWLEEHPIERSVEAYRRVIAPNVMVLEVGDAYFNYRLGLPQRGFFAPFFANIFIEDTALLLDDALGSGLVLLSRDGDVPAWVKDLNRASVMQERGHRFAAYRIGAGDFVEVKLEPISPSP